METNLAYQDELWDERIDGRVVAMSPRPSFNHNRVAFRIAHLFENYLEGKPCTVIADGTDLFLTQKDRFVPDVMVVCDRSKIKANGVHGGPDLAVEVLSRSTARRDRGYKMKRYAQCGVREYWLVSPADRSVEVYISDGGQLVFDNMYTLYSACELENMTEEERAEAVTHFRCSLYDDFEIHLSDIFHNLLP